jgi:hypothetical protein
MAKSALQVVDANKTNGGKDSIDASLPYAVEVGIEGASDLLFHRWNCEAVDTKNKAAKNSKAKKTDDIESYVWRDDAGEICLPGEYLRQSIIHAAKFRQDPRSPRKSAMDLFKAGVVSLTINASLGTKEWDYLDTRRVMIQRSGINRTRPAMKIGWKAEFVLQILTPEYIDVAFLNEVVSMAGRLVGVGDFRPTYGRFNISKFQVTNQ